MDIMQIIIIVAAVIGAVAAVAAAIFARLVWQSARGANSGGETAALKQVAEQNRDGIARLEGALNHISSVRETLEKRLDAIRESIEKSLNGFRTELEDRFGKLKESVESSMNSALKKTEEVKSENQQNAEKLRETVGEQLKETRSGLEDSMHKFRSELTAELKGMRDGIGENLEKIREGNEQKLDQMRATVDEKLQKTLESRIDKSFEKVTVRLTNLHEALGKMDALSESVGGLNRVLNSAPTRGAIAEHKLEDILREILAPQQYEKNAQVDPQSSERVEFAIRIPDTADSHRLLPVDSKFPMEDYERYVVAMENADKESARKYRASFIQRIKKEAQTIRQKYVKPPHSMDVAILFLPTEALYSVIASEPGLLESLHRQCRVRVTGPHNFSAMLDAIRAGLRLFTVSQHSKEIGEVLGAAKTEFEKFSGLLDKAKDNFRLGMDKLDEVGGRRTRAIERALRNVEHAPEAGSAEILNLETSDKNGEN